MEVQQQTTKQLTTKDIKKAFDHQIKEGQTIGQPKGNTGLSQKQARHALQDLGHNQIGLHVSKYWSEKQDDGRLTYEEFEKLNNTVIKDTDEVSRWAFNKFDANNDGTIDKDELKKILTMMYGDEDGEFVDDDFVNDVLKLADDNIDGVLQVEEVVDMVKAYM